MVSPRLVLAAVIAVGVVLSTTSLFGTPQQTAPTFVDKVDLVTADVRVVDKDGKAVPTLAAGDLVATLDGHPSEVVKMGPPAHSGRAFLLVFDDLGAQAQQLKGLTESAAHFLTTLQEADSVGLSTTSGLGPSIAPTRDRAAVLSALNGKDLVGRANARAPKPFVSVSEAFDMVRTGGNKDTGAKVVQRECSAGGGSSGGGGSKSRTGGGSGGGSADDSCATRVVAAARAEALLAEQTTGQQIAAYGRLFASLHPVPGAHSLILLTGGVALPLGISDAATVVGRAAAENDVALYGLVAIDDSDLATEASSDRIKARHDEDAFLTTGVESLAASTGGEAVRPGAGEADRVYARMLAATDSVYHLGFGSPSGASARYVGLKVSTKQPGLMVHAPAEAVHGSVEQPVAPAADALKQRIEQGGTRFGVPLALTASRRRDMSPTRVQAAMDVEVPASTPAPVSAMFALIDGTGKVVQSGRKDLVQTPGDPYRLAFGLPVDAGDYRLRLAVADGHGNIGSLDDVLAIRLPRVGTLATSDLVTASARGDAQPHLLALETLPAGAQALHVSLELYPEPQDAAGLKVQLSVGLASGGPAIVGGEVPGVLKDGRFLVSAALPVAALKPDRYVVTATILSSGKPSGTVTAYVRKIE